MYSFALGAVINCSLLTADCLLFPIIPLIPFFIIVVRVRPCPSVTIRVAPQKLIDKPKIIKYSIPAIISRTSTKQNTPETKRASSPFLNLRETQNPLLIRIIPPLTVLRVVITLDSQFLPALINPIAPIHIV